MTRSHLLALASTILFISIHNQVGRADLILGGPEPNGWRVESSLADVELEMNTAIGLGLLYETEVTQKKSLYDNGSPDVKTFAMKTFGTDAKMPQHSLNDPSYSIYVDTFEIIGTKYEEDLPGDFDGASAEDYANTLIIDLFDVEKREELLRGLDKDAVNVYGIWMRIHSYVYHIVRECKLSTPNETNMRIHLDRAMALYIGRLQVYGSNNRGTLMYNLVERAGVHFSQDDGETVINTKFLGIMNDIKDLISTCSSPDGYDNLYHKFHDFSSTMRVPLVQNLIHHISSRDTLFSEVYALSILPHIRSCDPQEFHYLMEKLVTADLTADTLQTVLPRIQRMYSCLGISCEDVGAYSGDRVPACEDHVVDPLTFGSYEATTDVRKYTRVDWDINHIDILLRKNHLGPAMEKYSKGYHMVNANGMVSLEDMAKHDDIPPTTDTSYRLYTMFKNYYGRTQEEEELYAYNMLLAGFDNTEAVESIVPRLLQTVVAPHYALRSFFAAYESCINDANRTASESYWDRGVAVLMGSMNPQSHEKEVSPPRNWFALEEELCPHFDCNDDNSINERMLNSLIDGKDRITRGGHCKELRNDITVVEELLVTPLLQGLLWFAANRGNDPENSNYYGNAYAFAKALIPLFYTEDPTYSDVIEENLTNGKADSVDVLKVFTNVARAIDRLGVPCAEIGTINDPAPGSTINGQNFCDFVNGLIEETSRPTPEARPPTPSPTAAPTRDDGIINNEFLDDYSFTNATAKQSALIALDMKEILLLRDGDEHVVTTKDVYRKSGMKDYNTNAPDNMANDPYYNFYRYALRGDTLFTNYLNGNHNEVDIYADAIVETAITSVMKSEFTYETLVVTTIWMQVVHTLTSAVNNCKVGSPSSTAFKIDEAYALYIGEDQSKGKTDGYLLYALAQRAASLFKTFTHHHSRKEAKVNREIHELFILAKQEAVLCDGEETSFINIRSTIGNIISKMNVPLLQLLLHQLKNARKEKHRDSNLITLYSLSVLPQAATCDPRLYDTLSDALIDHVFTGAEADEMMSLIEESYDCFGITCEDVHGVNSDCVDYFANAGYDPFFEDSTKFARLDQDVLKMKALILEDASTTAADYYKYGSLMGLPEYLLPRVSLETLAKAQFQNVWPGSQSINSYYDSGDTNYGHVKVTSVLNEDIGKTDKVEKLLRTVQTMVLFPYGFGSLYDAMEELCSGSVSDIPLTETEIHNVYRKWDNGVAVLIGSIEGNLRGGDPSNQGVSMYALGKEMCNHFDTCAGSGDAETNEELLENYRFGGKTLIKHHTHCELLTSMVKFQIQPRLLVPIIQGVILHLMDGYDSNPTLNTLAESIIPIVSEKNSTSGETIKANTQLSGGGESVQVIDAFSVVLQDLSVDCMEIGTVVPSICGDVFDPEVETSLLGIYMTVTNVEDRANIALDVKEMLKKLQDGDKSLAKLYYEDGLNSRIYDSALDRRRQFSIKMMSTQSSIRSNETIHNLYMYSLQGSDGKFYGNAVHQHSDSLVQSFFNSDGILDDGRDERLPVEAAIALNVWSWCTHELYETIERCTDGETLDHDGVRSIDEAVAYWIGAGPEDSTGYLLYHMTQEIGKFFGENGVVRANKNIIALFKDAAMQLTTAGACNVDDLTTVNSLRSTVNDLIGKMTVPLIQSLIHYLVLNDRDRVQIYGHAVIPLLARCRADRFSYLKEKVLGLSYRDSDVNEIISILQSSYSCLGLKCNDIGIHQDTNDQIAEVPECVDDELAVMGGYKPSYDVRGISRIDVDIRCIEIMMEMKAYRAAQEIYEFGMHASVRSGTQEEVVSLRSLALDAEGRSNIPIFDVFKNHYGSDVYADIELMKIFDQLERGTLSSEISPEQETALVVKTLQYLVMPMAALTKLYEAGKECSQKSLYYSMKRKWQEGAAMLIGSMEGSSHAGSGSGYMIFGLAQSLCFKFGTCFSSIAKVNSNIDTLLSAGAFELTEKSCGDIQGIVSKIESQMLVALIQATLYYAVENSQLKKGTTSEDFATGYIIADAVIPYIKEGVKGTDSNADVKIEENMELQYGLDPVRDGYITVFRQFKEALKHMADVDCMDVGTYEQVGFGVCEGVKGDPGSAASYTSTNAILISSILASVLLLMSS